MKIEVLYEDNHLLVVNKPINLLVQEDHTGDPDLLNELKNFIKERDKKPGNVFMGLVHRLDRPVGGVIVFAKTSKAASRLSNEIRKNKFDRKYLAVVRGTHLKNSGKLTDYLYKNKKKNIVYVVDSNHSEGKKAVLNYKVLGKTDDFSLLEVELETGRSHQIRVQLANMGAPLYGDQKYGQHVNKPGQQIALFAKEISVKHPTKDEIVRVSVQPNDEFPWNQFDAKI